MAVRQEHPLIMPRNRRRRTRFDLAEHIALMYQLQRDPLSVLTHFRDQGVLCLAQLEGWGDICLYHPAIADCIRDVATLLDIPERIGKE